METYESPIAVMYCCACWMTRRPRGRELRLLGAAGDLRQAQAMARSAAAVAAATLDPPAVSRAAVVVPVWAGQREQQVGRLDVGWCLPRSRSVAAWAKAS